MMVDKEQEDFANVSASLGTLDHLQAQAQEQMASISQIPLVWFLGITPTGLNPTADGEIRVFYDRVRDWQERIGHHLTKAIEILQLNEFGEIDPDIQFEWKSLWQLDEAGEAAVQKIKIDTDDVLIAAGVISPEEVRTRLAGDPESPYHGLEGPPPEPPDMPPPGEEDAAGKVGGAAIQGKETGANSGV